MEVTKDLVESHAVKIGRRSSGAGARMLLQNRENFGKSSAPARFMVYENGGCWRDFPQEVIGEVRRAFVMRRPAAEIRAFGSELVVDFLRMAAVEVGSGTEQSVAWIDDRGQCFFPKEFIGPEKMVVEVQVESAKRKRGQEEEAASKEDEVSWTREETPKRRRFPLDEEAESSAWPKARRVGAGERLHSVVKDKFMAGFRAAEVTAIHVCKREGEKDKAREAVFRKQEEITRAHRGRGSSTTATAWFGGSKKEVERILCYGFGAVSCVSGCYGVGVQLSRPRLSAEIAELDESGEKHLLLCEVIVGNMEKVEKGSRQCFPSSPDLDTGCDDPNHPQWHIVWPSHIGRFILPRLVVSFKHSNLAKGRIDARPTVGREQYSFDVLIPELQTSLPPVRGQELVTLYGQYRTGNLQRDAFVKRLRCVAGDQKLVSVVRKIRGF